MLKKILIAAVCLIVAAYAVERIVAYQNKQKALAIIAAYSKDHKARP